MTVIRVVVEEWQQACCGRRFRIGDEVRWRLLLLDAADMHLPDDVATTVDAEAVVWGAPDDGRTPIMVRAGDLTAFWRAPLRVEGHAAVRGVFYEEHHGGVPRKVKPTLGTVTRIRALWAPKDVRVSDGTRGYFPRWGPLDLRDLSSSEDDPYGGGPSPGPDYLLDGWLVDLQVSI